MEVKMTLLSKIRNSKAGGIGSALVGGATILIPTYEMLNPSPVYAQETQKFEDLKYTLPQFLNFYNTEKDSNGVSKEIYMKKRTSNLLHAYLDKYLDKRALENIPKQTENMPFDQSLAIIDFFKPIFSEFASDEFKMWDINSDGFISEKDDINKDSLITSKDVELYKLKK